VKTGRNATSRSGDPAATEIDRYRSIVFPNRVREHRKHHGYPTLLALAAELPAMAYIRLSKIERGEVVAKPDELRQIAAVLHVDPAALLLDVDAPDFDIAAWATDLQGLTPAEVEEDRFAVLLAAAIRARRDADRSLSIAQIERSYGLAPVILSRFENGYKPLARWNAQAVRAVCALLGAADVADLRAQVQRAHVRQSGCVGLGAVLRGAGAMFGSYVHWRSFERSGKPLHRRRGRQGKASRRNHGAFPRYGGAQRLVPAAAI